MENIQATLQAFTDKANLFWAAILAILSQLFGRAGPVLLFFLVLNVVDTYYGRKKAKETNTLSSAKGAKGIGKKVSYWVMIALAFGAASVLVNFLGPEIGVDLGFLRLIGWFTLAVYILNEMTSIVENMLVLGYDVPEILVKGLAVARSAVDMAGEKIIPETTEKSGEKERKESGTTEKEE